MSHHKGGHEGILFPHPAHDHGRKRRRRHLPCPFPGRDFFRFLKIGMAGLICVRDIAILIQKDKMEKIGRCSDEKMADWFEYHK